MAIEQTQLILKRGDSWSRTLIFENDKGSRSDISKWTVMFTLKESILDTDDEGTGNTAIIIKNILPADHTNPKQGETQLSLSSKETKIEPKSYLFDIQVVTDKIIEGEPEVLTILEGFIIIQQDISQRIS